MTAQGKTRAKALQTVSRFPKETRRRYAVPQSTAFTLIATLFCIDYVTLFSYVDLYQHLEAFLLTKPVSSDGFSS